MKKLLKYSLKTILIIIGIGVLYLNVRMYYEPITNESSGHVYNSSVYAQLQFLKEAMHNGAGDEMQMIFPEGFVYINALYGLSWADAIEYADKESAYFQEGIVEITWALEQINSDKGRFNFSENLPLAYGAYYTSWNSYLRGKALSVQEEKGRKQSDIQTFKNDCYRLAEALEDADTPYLESYVGSAWPADIVTGVAALALYDKMFKPRYDSLIDVWVDKVKNNLDPQTGLIPHKAAASWSKLEGARGSSQSQMLCFLKEIDEPFANEQFAKYKELFLAYRAGLPGIREYPKGIEGRGDIDSGPVIFGIGGAASIVGQRAMYEFGETEVYEGLRNSIEGFGAAYTSDSKKRYVFGQLPIADAFICWSNAVENKPSGHVDAANWRLSFQLISLVVLVILALGVWKM